jgi:hypothetical protein
VSGTEARVGRKRLRALIRHGVHAQLSLSRRSQSFHSISVNSAAMVRNGISAHLLYGFEQFHWQNISRREGVGVAAHRMTSFARMRRGGGVVRRSAWATLRLMTSSIPPVLTCRERRAICEARV